MSKRTQAATRTVGVRELKQKASEIVRRVREDKDEIDITYRGKVVARIVPVKSEEERKAELSAFWERYERLVKEIDAHWPEGVSAVDAVREQRREL